MLLLRCRAEEGGALASAGCRCRAKLRVRHSATGLPICFRRMKNLRRQRLDCGTFGPALVRGSNGTANARAAGTARQTGGGGRDNSSLAVGAMVAVGIVGALVPGGDIEYPAGTRASARALSAVRSITTPCSIALSRP